MWIFHREDFTTQEDGVCSIYLLFQASDLRVLSNKVYQSEPGQSQIDSLFKMARKQSKGFPKKILISKKEDSIDLVDNFCGPKKIVVECVPPKEIEAEISEFLEGFLPQFVGERAATLGISDDPFFIAEESAKDFLPDAYDQCPCNSQKKYKFCCKPIFRDIVDAMCAFEENQFAQALEHVNIAEKKVGRTPEVLARLAICHSNDPEKFHALLGEALKLNPKHPRSNYLLGLDAVNNGDFEKGIKFYKKAIEFYPQTARYYINETLVNLGTAYFSQGEFKKAKDAWEKAVALLPSDPISKRNLLDYIYGNDELKDSDRQASPFVEKIMDKYLEEVQALIK